MLDGHVEVAVTDLVVEGYFNNLTIFIKAGQNKEKNTIINYIDITFLKGLCLYFVKFLFGGSALLLFYSVGAIA